MKNILPYILFSFIAQSPYAQTISSYENGVTDSLNKHRVILDQDSKILSWITPQAKAYSWFLHKRWDYIKNNVPNCPGPGTRSSYPQYYFYCAYQLKNGNLQPDMWMNDIGERIPNWF